MGSRVIGYRSEILTGGAGRPLAFSGGPAINTVPPRPLFPAGRLFRNPGAGYGEPYYDLAPDGQSVLVNRVVHDAAVEPISVVLDWPSVIGK